jgi:hypothetical protein
VRVRIIGSNGLIGSEAVSWFDSRGPVYRVDDNMRRDFMHCAAQPRHDLAPGRPLDELVAA